ncbi:MAG: hypothetical protein KME26_23175 [Oscillatoria princeps RMCB-10]|jgi:hypothetical protein|nr:hypothetical protein [Oscillatoria princeps RMCB-10]
MPAVSGEAAPFAVRAGIVALRAAFSLLPVAPRLLCRCVRRSTRFRSNFSTLVQRAQDLQNFIKKCKQQKVA